MNTILAIDDDTNMLKLLSKQVESMGFTLLTAHSGASGIDYAKSGSPDLILLDIMMPEMDGFEVIRQLKKDDLTKNIPVIMLTSRSSKYDVAVSMRYGVVDYIVKPYNYFNLSKKIDAALRYSMKLREVDMIERTNNIDISRNRGITVISFKSGLSNREEFDEARKVFSTSFLNLIAGDDVVLDLRGIKECCDDDMAVLEKIIALIKAKGTHIVAGKNYGILVEKIDFDESNLFITMGDFEVFINRE